MTLLYEANYKPKSLKERRSTGIGYQINREGGQFPTARQALPGQYRLVRKFTLNGHKANPRLVGIFGFKRGFGVGAPGLHTLSPHLVSMFVGYASSPQLCPYALARAQE